MALNLGELNSLIASATGVEWQAAETSISLRARAPAGPGNLFGLSVSPDEMLSLKKNADEAQRTFQAAAPPPRKVDWRIEKGFDWLNPIRDQKSCGACVAFATVATLESGVKLEQDDAALALALSEAHLFFCGAGRACRNGWNFVPALDHCQSVGVGLAAHAPYQPVNQACPAIRSVVKVTDWQELAARQARLQAIATGGPVIAGMRVFEDFYYYKSGVYRHVAGDYKGLHAVCVVGYDEDRQCWIVRNSWGTDWGDDGYFAIGYGECGIDSEFVFFAPEVVHDPGGFDEAAAVKA